MAPNIPKKILDDENFRFGKPSGYNDPDRPKFEKVMNYNYLYDQLCHNIHDRAMETVKSGPTKIKDWRNKSYHLRS